MPVLREGGGGGNMRRDTRQCDAVCCSVVVSVYVPNEVCHQLKLCHQVPAPAAAVKFSPVGTNQHE